MKKVMRKLKKSLSVFLAVAMMITLVPQTAFAAEVESIPVTEETVVEPITDTTPDTTPDTENNGTTEGDASASPEEPSQPSDDTAAVEVKFVKDDAQVTVTGEGTTPVTGGDYTFTAEVNKGYENLEVKAYTTASYTTESKIEVAVIPPTDNSNTYTIEEKSLSDPITIVVSATPVAATETKYNVTITNNNEDAISNITYAVGNVAEFAAYEAAVEVAENSAFKFKFDLSADYEAEVQVGNETLQPDENGVYTIAKVTEGITIILSATGKQPAETFDVTVNVTPTDAATVTYTNDCVADGKIAKGTDLTFTAAAKDEEKEVSEVKYAVGTEVSADTATVITADDKGTYTIAFGQITGAVTIYVTVTDKAAAEYQVTFHINGAAVKSTAEGTPAISGQQTVTAGDSISFTVEVTEGNKLRYVSTTDNADGAITDVDGVYTVTPEADMDVYVKATATETHILSFEFDETKVGVEAYKKAAEEDIKLTLNNKAVEVTEDDEVYFEENEVENSVYKISEVKVNDEAVTPDEKGKYNLGKLSADTEVVVESELDEEKCNVLTFAGNAFTAKVSGNDSASADTEYKTGEKLLTDKPSVDITIQVNAGYALESVQLGDDTLTATEIAESGKATYSVSFTEEKKQQTLTVKTKVNASEEAKTVSFTNTSDKLAVTMKTDEVTKVTGKNNTYSVAAGVDYLEFNVTPQAGYTPVVSFTTEGITPEMEESVVKGKTVYSYKVPVAAMGDMEYITIAAKVTTQTISVQYDPNEVKISAKIGAKQVEESSNDVESITAVYAVNYGETLTVSAAAEENCKVTGAATTIGGVEKSVKVKAAGFETPIKATADTSLVITSEGIYTANVLQKNENGEEGDKLTAVKNVYTVDYNAKYIAGATYGVEDRVEIAKVEVLEGKNPVETTTAVIDEDKTKVTIQVAEADAGKKLTVNLYASEDKKVATYSLSVLPVLSEVVVAGVTNGKVTQTIDTWKDYKLTLTPKTADITKLLAETTGNVTAEVDSDGTLGIGTKVAKEAGTEETAGTVKLYYMNNGNRVYVKGGEIAVSTEAPAALEKSTPTVKVKDSDDVSITLTLGRDKKIEEPKGGRLYYKVEITPQAGEDMSASIEASTVKYIFAGDSLQQDEKIIVNAAELGRGQAWKFDVKVTLLQTTDGNELTKDNETEKTAFRSKTNETLKDKEAAATKAPYYETKLSLKKGTTTIYTGPASDLIAAQVVWSKNTTWKAIAKVEDISFSENSALDLSIEEEDDGNHQIGMSASAATAVGKHVIKVTAKAPENTEPATATITVNVVRGIESLKVTTPATQIYKADKKAASLKAGVIYNNNETTPKTKKVTWEIVDTNGDALDENDALYNMVTVKNGTVSVNKNYVVSANEADNKFKIKAKAADYSSNTVEACSGVITITSEATPMGEVVIVEANSNSYNVVARSSSTVSSGEIDGAYAVVLKKGTPEKDSYTRDEFEVMRVDKNQYTLKSSSKAVTIDDNGLISVTGTAKNVKITATATDGSKQSAALQKLNVGYAAVEELALKLMDLNDNVINATEDGYAITAAINDGTAAAGLYFEVCRKTGAEWDTLDEYANYTITVNGGKIAGRDGAFGETGWLTINTATATITLKDKTNNQTTEYVITNNGFIAKAETPKAKASGNLTANNEAAQTVTYALSNDKYSFADKYVKVVVDLVDGYKNLERYREFNNALFEGSLEIILPVSDKKFTLNFNGSVPAGSYKMLFTYGTVDADGNFVPDSMTTAVTLKAVAAKTVKGSLSVPTAYTMSVKDGGQAEIKPSGKEINSVSIGRLSNVNVNGNANGFMTYFEVIQDDGKNYIALKDSLTEEQLAHITSKAGAADCQGYLTYSGTVGNPSVTVEKTVKITVKFKDTIAKYAVSNASVFAAKESADGAAAVATATVNVTANKEPAVLEVAYVYDGEFAVENVNGANITLKNAAAETMKYPLKMYIVTKDSNYKTIVTTAKTAYDAVMNRQDAAADDKAAAKVAYEEVLKKYAVAVKSTITVENAETKTGKIKIGSTKLTLTKEDYAPAATKGAYGDYTKSVAYTMNVQDSIKSITSNNELFRFGTADEKIQVSLNKKALMDAVTAGTVSYEGSVTVEATVEFNVGKQETVKFTIKLPKEAQTYEDALAKANAIKSEEIQWVYSSDMSKDEIVAQNKISVANALNKVIEQDCDMAFENEVKYQPTSKEDSGSIQASVTVFNNTEADGTEENLTWTYEIPMLTMEVSDIKEKVTDFVDLKENDTTYAANDTTASKIAADVRAAVGEIPSSIRVRVSKFQLTEATDAKVGKISGEILVYSLTNAENKEKISFNFTIQKLATLTETKKEIVEALRSFEATNETTKEELLAFVESKITNKNITAAWEQIEDSASQDEIDNFLKTDATVEEAGKIIYGIVLTNSAAEGETVTISNADVDLVIKQLMNAEAAVSAVKKAAGSDAAAALAASIVEDEVKAAILEAAQEAIAHQPYTVAYAKSEDEDADAFSFTAPTYKTDGSLAYTLEVKDSEGVVVAGGTIKVTDVVISARANLQTLAEAKTDVEEADDFTATNSTSKDNVTDWVRGIIKSLQIIVALKDGEGAFTLTPATIKAAGSLTATYVLTKDSETCEVTITKEIAMLEQTKDEAATAAKAAAEAVSVDNADAAEGEAKTEVILAAAKEAVAEKYTVAVNPEAELNITPATINKAGSATMTLVIKEGAEDGEPKEVICSWTIEALDQTADEATAAANQAIADFAASAETTADNVLDAVKAVLKTGVYTAAWSTGAGFNNDTTGNIAGTIIITYNDGEGDQTIEIDATMSYTVSK